MSSLNRTVDGQTLPHAQCRYCHQVIVEASEVGWLDPTPGDTYDMCRGSVYADHQPSDARGDTRIY